MARCGRSSGTTRVSRASRQVALCKTICRKVALGRPATGRWTASASRPGTPAGGSAPTPATPTGSTVPVGDSTFRPSRSRCGRRAVRSSSACPRPARRRPTRSTSVCGSTWSASRTCRGTCAPPRRSTWPSADEAGLQHAGLEGVKEHLLDHVAELFGREPGRVCARRRLPRSSSMPRRCWTTRGEGSAGVLQQLRRAGVRNHVSSSTKSTG